MKQQDDTLYLLHIQECISRIEKYLGGRRARLFKSPLVQDAVLRVLQIMTESTQRLSEGLKASCPQVNWTGMAGFRNVLVHGYLQIDLDKVSTVIEKELPKLKRDLAPLFKGLPKPPTKKVAKQRSTSRKRKRK